MGHKILLVEDNPVNRKLIHRRFRSSTKFDFEVAVDGEEAIKKAVENQPDLILMDMSLPNIDGWTASQEIKSHPASQHIPIIALTAHVMEKDRRRAIEVGCDGFIPKPIDFKLLVPMMEDLLENQVEPV